MRSTFCPGKKRGVATSLLQGGPVASPYRKASPTWQHHGVWKRVEQQHSGLEVLAEYSVEERREEDSEGEKRGSFSTFHVATVLSSMNL